MNNDQGRKNRVPTVRVPRLAARQFTKDAVTNELRGLFFREIERCTPEVIEKLRDKVLPLYIKAYDAIQQAGSISNSVFFPSQCATRQESVADCTKAVVDWAKEVRLLHGNGPPNWVVEQAEATLQVWARNPNSVVARWLIIGVSKWEQRRPQDYLVELPQFTWHWIYGYESKRQARKRILHEVAKIVDTRLTEMEEAVKAMPRLPTKSKPEHLTCTVLNQIRGVRLEDLAKQFGVQPTTLRNAVMLLKARLGIGLPKGRPKKK